MRREAVCSRAMRDSSRLSPSKRAEACRTQRSRPLSRGPRTRICRKTILTAQWPRGFQKIRAISSRLSTRHTGRAVPNGPNEPLVETVEANEERLGAILEALNKHDDVQRVFTNARGYENTDA